MIHTVKGFSVVSEAEVDLGGGGGKEQFHSFFCDPMNVGNLISSSFAFSKSRLYIWKFSYCWSLTWRILSIILIACAMLCLVTQPCPTLYDPMDYSPPGSSVHGDSPGKSIRVSCHALLQGIFPTLGLNPGFSHFRWTLYCLSHQGSPRILEGVTYPFSRRSSWPRSGTGVSCIAGKFFTSWATREDRARYLLLL